VHAQELSRVEPAFQVADVEVAERATLGRVDPGVVPFGAEERPLGHVDEQDPPLLPGRGDLAQHALARRGVVARGLPVGRLADDVMALLVDPDFDAVGCYYKNFPQTSTEEVLELLEAVNSARSICK